MPTCPACHWENPDGAAVCEQCSSQFPRKFDTESRTALDLNATLVQPVSGTHSGKDSVLAIGDVVANRYRVLDKIGSGGMGCVYRVLDRHLDRVIALKTINPQLSSDPDALRHFKQEILAARQISHKNVIRVFDFGLDGELGFITMEYFEGEDLRSRLRRKGKFSPGEAIPVMRQICQGLSSAHSEGIIHRDLKPQNILISDNNEIRILDFGLARLYESTQVSAAGVLSGTPDYMSPEQVKGERLDARSDLFSAGIVFYELLTGDLPFHGDTLMARLLARTGHRAEPLSVVHPEIPLAMSAIVSRCLERDRSRRYSSADEVLHALEQISNLEPASRVSTALFRLTSGVKKRYSLAVGLALALLICIAAVWIRYSHSEPAVKSLPPAKEPYVAVLPFAVASGADADHAAEGIRETLSSRLAAVQSIHTVAPAAVDKADLKRSDEEIARQLGANVLVRGNLAGENGQLRAQIAVYDVQKRATIWSANAAAGSGDVLELENDLANKLFDALRISPPQNSGTVEPPTRSMEAYDLYLQGRDALKNHRGDPAAVSQALDSFRRAIGIDGSFALAWTGVADASLELYRLNHDTVNVERARDAARRASRMSNLPEVHLAAGSVYTQTGQHQEAVAEIRRALGSEPNSDDAHVRLGRAYLESGQTDLALKELERAVKLNPFYWYNHDQLARALFRVGRDKDALLEFKKVAELVPDSASAHLGIASVLVRQGKWEQSIPEYQKSLAIKPSANAYTSLGTAFFYLRRYAEAVPNFEKAAQLDSRNPVALGNLGTAYRQLGKKQKATAAFTHAIEAAYRRLQLNPRDSMMLGSAALYNAYNGQSEEALSLIGKARNIDPASNELMYTEAVVRTLAGPSQVPSALAALKQAIENGYSLEEARRDPDLNALKDYPEFKALGGLTPP